MSKMNIKTGDTVMVISGKSKVQLICPKCKQPTRVGYKTLEDGTKVRVCKNKDCGETF